MAFTLVAGQHAYTATIVGNTFVVTLPNNPTTGNTVCLGFAWYNGSAASSTIVSILDANLNAYTVTPNSPSAAHGAACGAGYLAYLLKAPSNASKTITITFTTTPTGGAAWADEFHSNAPNTIFDKDAAGSGTGATVNTPSLTPTGANELIYSYATVFNSVTAVGGSWVCPETLPVAGGDGAAYILSVSAATVPSFSQTSGLWDSMSMAFDDGAFEPPAAALTLTGGTPTVTSGGGSTFSPTAAALTLTGGTATEDLGVHPSVASLILAASSPTVALQFVGVNTGLTLTGNTPTQGLGMPPSAAALTLTGGIPSLSGGGSSSFSPSGGALALAGGTAVAAFGLGPSGASLALGGGTPASGLGLSPTGAALLLTGGVPTVTGGGGSGTTMSPVAGALSLAGGTAVAGFGYAPSGTSLTLTGFAPGNLNPSPYLGIGGHMPLLGVG